MTARKPNTTGLQAIETGAINSSGHRAPFKNPVPSAAEVAARRMSDRLEVASADIPVRNSTVRGGQPYTCPELRTNPHRPGSADAFSLPSRTSFRTPQSA